VIYSSFSPPHVLPLPHKGSQLFGVLKKSLKESRKLNKENIKKHNIDIMLAATAIVENCIFGGSFSGTIRKTSAEVLSQC
jgi:predicted nucleic acid-binding protein